MGVVDSHTSVLNYRGPFFYVVPFKLDYIAKLSYQYYSLKKFSLHWQNITLSMDVILRQNRHGVMDVITT